MLLPLLLVALHTTAPAPVHSVSDISQQFTFYMDGRFHRQYLQDDAKDVRNWGSLSKLDLSNANLLLLTGGDARVVSRGIRVPHALWPDMVYGGLEACFPQTAAERAGRLSGAPEVPAPVTLEKIRASLAFSMLL